MKVMFLQCLMAEDEQSRSRREGWEHSKGGQIKAGLKPSRANTELCSIMSGICSSWQNHLGYKRFG